MKTIKIKGKEFIEVSYNKYIEDIGDYVIISIKNKRNFYIEKIKKCSKCGK